MHSIAGGATLPGGRPFVSESWMLDNNTGPAYAVAAADLRYLQRISGLAIPFSVTLVHAAGSYSTGASGIFNTFEYV